MTEMVAVKRLSDIDVVAGLARATWMRHYTPIIGAAQVAYMLEKFQSAAAITAQIAGGYAYYLVSDEGQQVGYFALVPNADEGSMMLSKIYILPERQGRGLGQKVVAFAERQCVEQGLRRLWLTVNKNNVSSIAFYTRMGFATEASVVNDIGSGFAMDDFVMAKRLA